MHASIETNRAALATLCHRYHVKRLELFGSAATGGFKRESSDLDFLVEFDVTDAMNPADQYFGLWDELKKLFRRDVDLVTVGSLRNPYFIRTVNETKTMLYAA